MIDLPRERERTHSKRIYPPPGQDLSLDDLERIELNFGPFGTDPCFGSVPGHPHIAQVRRDADEQTRIFAETWHSDRSFLALPPQATLLYGNIIPPVGGDTLFANRCAPWDALPARLQARLHHRDRGPGRCRGHAAVDGALRPPGSRRLRLPPSLVSMLVMWDNRCVVHAATGGHLGLARLLHRITLAERAVG